MSTITTCIDLSAGSNKSQSVGKHHTCAEKNFDGMGVVWNFLTKLIKVKYFNFFGGLESKNRQNTQKNFKIYLF